MGGTNQLFINQNTSRQKPFLKFNCWKPLPDDAVRVSTHSARSAAGTVFTGVGEPNIVVTHLDVFRLHLELE